MSLRMSEGLRRKSAAAFSRRDGGKPRFRGFRGAAPKGKLKPQNGTLDRNSLWLSYGILPSLTGRRAVYASGAGKGRSSGGTPQGRCRKSHGLGRGQGFSGSRALRKLQIAAEALSYPSTSFAGEIDDFERQIGATLFTRDVHGTRLTTKARCRLSRRTMEAASFDLVRASNSVTHTLSGEVRVAVTEGLGTFGWPLAWSNSSNLSQHSCGSPLRDALGRCVAA